MDTERMASVFGRQVHALALLVLRQPGTGRHALVRSTVFWLLIGIVLLGLLFLPIIQDHGAFTYRLV